MSIRSRLDLYIAETKQKFREPANNAFLYGFALSPEDYLKLMMDLKDVQRIRVSEFEDVPNYVSEYLGLRIYVSPSPDIIPLFHGMGASRVAYYSKTKKD